VKRPAILRDRSGHTAIEYCLLACAVALVIITSVQFMGESVNGMFESITTGFEGDS
jgi:Flp pilus assembly pilin Flp